MDLATITASTYPPEKRDAVSGAIQLLLDFVNEGEADYLERYADKIRELEALYVRHGFQKYAFEYELAKAALMAHYERQVRRDRPVNRVAVVGILANGNVENILRTIPIARRMLEQRSPDVRVALFRLADRTGTLPELKPVVDAYFATLYEHMEREENSRLRNARRL